MPKFNHRLKQLRQERMLSQQEFANMIGISKSSINMYERGEREPGIETLEAIADFFNVDMDYLLGKSQHKNKQAWLADEASITSVGELMRERRKQLGISAETVAEAIGVSPATVYRYEKGDIEKVPGDLLNPIAKVLNTTPAYLMGWTDETEDPIAGVKNIFRIEKKKFRLLGNIACGEPIFANEEHELYVVAGSDIDADFCLRAQGDSMTGARIFDGDIVFIKEQPMVENGEIAAVIIGDEATLKRVQYDRENNEIALFAENPAYKTQRYKDAELDSIRILGKAVAFQSYIL